MWLNTALWLVCTPQCGWQTAIWPWPRPFPSVRNDMTLVAMWVRHSWQTCGPGCQCINSENIQTTVTQTEVSKAAALYLATWWYWTVTPLRENLEILRDKSEGRYCTGIRYEWNSFEPMLHIDDMVLPLATGCCKWLGKLQYEAVNCSTRMEYWNSLDCYKCLIQYRTEARTYLLIKLLC